MSVGRVIYIVNVDETKTRRREGHSTMLVIIVWKFFLKRIVEWVGESFEDKFLTELDLLLCGMSVDKVRSGLYKKEKNVDGNSCNRTHTLFPQQWPLIVFKSKRRRKKMLKKSIDKMWETFDHLKTIEFFSGLWSLRCL